MGPSGNNVDMGGRLNSNVSPMANVKPTGNSVWDTKPTDEQIADSKDTANKRSKTPTRSFGDELKSVAEFVRDETLGFDDFGWAVKNASEGNWMEAAKSAVGGAVELGSTVAAVAAAVPSLGGSLGALGAKQGAKKILAKGAAQSLDDVGKVGMEQAIKNADTIAANKLKNAQALAGGKILEKEGFKKIEKSVIADEVASAKAAAKDQKFMDTVGKGTEQLAKETLENLPPNPFKFNAGKGKGGGRGGENGGPSGRGTGGNGQGGNGQGGNGQGGLGGSGGPGGVKELVSAGIRETSRAVDDLPPTFRPQPPKPQTPKPLPGGSDAVKEATETVAEQALRSDPDAVAGLIKLRGPQFKGAMGLAGLAGLGTMSGSSVMNSSAVNNMTKTSLSASTTTPTKMVGEHSGPGGGGGGKPAPTSDIPSPADRTDIPYVY